MYICMYVYETLGKGAQLLLAYALRFADDTRSFCVIVCDTGYIPIFMYINIFHRQVKLETRFNIPSYFWHVSDTCMAGCKT